MKQFFLLLSFFFAFYDARAGELLNKLQAIKEISDIQEVKEETFKEAYVFFYEQAIDHDNLSVGSFKQKVFLGHKDTLKVVVAELEGYAMNSTRANELSKLLDANQLKIEHRFFDKSVPSSGIAWEQLTVEQAATDCHLIIETLKEKLYPHSKWVSTGISKGGQATIMHRYFYPEDVDVSVPYVAPLNLERIDPRIEKFLNKVGTQKLTLTNFVFAPGGETENCSWRVRDFQKLCFTHKAVLQKMLEDEAEKKGYEFQLVGGFERAVELIILEYKFAFWQYSGECSTIPIESSDAADEEDLREVFEHLIRISPPSFFADSDITKMYPFMYAAYIELGFYDYKKKHFKQYLSKDVPNQGNITFDFALPQGIALKPFNKAQMKAVKKWLQTDADKILFIYGENDPWSATAVDLKMNSKCSKYVKGGLGHACQIKDFEAITRQDILDTLKEWLR
ncbi:tripeptidyl aminopeptidase [Bacteroidia bacterium]|nr:tripeptidyl aminopeptidase [Bacteroidia bacterium]